MQLSQKYQGASSQRNNPNQLFMIFVVSVIVLAFFVVTLQQIGTPLAYLTYMAFWLLILIYPVIGILSRTMKGEDYHFIGGRGHPVFNGLAIAGAAISGSAIIFLPGQFFNNGSSSTLLIMGLAIGIAIATLFIAPQISRRSAYTLPMFLGVRRSQRISSAALKIISSVCVVTVSILFALTQMKIAMEIGAVYLGFSPVLVVSVLLLAILSCILPGGMRGLTWARVGFATIAAFAFALPIVWISFAATNIPIPQLAIGTGALELLQSFQNELARQGFEKSADLVSISTNRLQFDAIDTLVIVSVIAAGTAAMPHLLQHHSTQPSASGTRKAGLWALALTLLVLTLAPAYAAFLKLEIYNLVVGIPVTELDELVPWFFDRGEFDGKPLVQICGEAAVSLQASVAACGGTQPYPIAPADFELHPSLVLMDAQAIADLPPAFLVLIAIGAFAAIFSTLDGNLLSASNSVSNDIVGGVLRPRAPQSSLLFLSRLFLVLTVALVAYVSLSFNIGFELLLALTFATTAATIFPSVILRSTNRTAGAGALLLTTIVGVLLLGLHAVTNFLGPDLIFATGDEITWFTSSKTDFLGLYYSGFLAGISSLALGYIYCLVRPITAKELA